MCIGASLSHLPRLACVADGIAEFNLIPTVHSIVPQNLEMLALELHAKPPVHIWNIHAYQTYPTVRPGSNGILKIKASKAQSFPLPSKDHFIQRILLGRWTGSNRRRTNVEIHALYSSLSHVFKSFAPLVLFWHRVIGFDI